MLSPENIRRQIERLTADLIGTSLCSHQNFPATATAPGGVLDVGLCDRTSLSAVLKNVPYPVIYNELDRTQSYSLKMLDGALIQIMYRFRNHRIEAHRLAFFPSPSLEEFQNNPEIYLEDEIYADVVKKNIVPFPVRFDFDNRPEVVRELVHPQSHLTLGQFENCRIPVNSPLTPHQFITFILRNFYHTANSIYGDKITCFKRHCFTPSICDADRELIHVVIPNIQGE